MSAPGHVTVQVVIKDPIEVEVDLREVSTKALADALALRDDLSEAEVTVITSGAETLREHYFDIFEQERPAPEHPVVGDLDEVRSRLMRGDLAEAIILIGRLHPALADLPHAFERRA